MLQVAIEVIYVGTQSLAYSIILYLMIGFEPRFENFLWFYYFIFMCFMYFTLYGMMTVALTPNYQIAAIVMSFFINFWNLFSGFLIPRTVCMSITTVITHTCIQNIYLLCIHPILTLKNLLLLLTFHFFLNIIVMISN